MLEECPHCHKRTISRWRDALRLSFAPLICPNCHTPIKVSNTLQAVLAMLPVTVCGYALIYWEPMPPEWVRIVALTVTGILGFVLSYKLPRYKEVKGKHQ